MPNVEINLNDLGALVGKKLSLERVREALLFVKGEIDSVDGNEIVVDVKETNRPDLLSAEGIARELKGHLGKEKGLAKYDVKSSGVKVIADASVSAVRPCIAAAIARNVKVDGNFIKQMVQLQEKVCLTFGRKRKEAAIGLYDFDAMKAPIHYKAFAPHELKFVPLEYRVEMDLDEILKEHPKGKEYAHLLQGCKKYPILIDSADVVASMPPIINSQATGKVTEKTRNLFVEVTGMRQETVNTALNVIASALAERNAKIESVQIVYPKSRITTPDFTPGKISVDVSDVQKISGLELGAADIVKLLRNAHYDAAAKGKKIIAEYPAYRQDILHPIDVIEDIIIAYGYEKIAPAEVKIATIGNELQNNRIENACREVCVGLGLQEVLTFTLTSKEKQQRMMELPEQQFVEIANPVSTNWSVLRRSVVPELLEFLSKNKNCPYPQKIFEIGRTLALDASAETGVKERTQVCIAISHKNANFTEIKSHLNALLQNLGIKYETRAMKHPSFAEGRAAEIVALGKCGILGEVGEKVLKNFLIDAPVAVLEFEI
ncbi:MAG: phenylalanine--tRNA ligase subunit beta [Candidatus Diapherotrites archaeon]|nr:phenylalanine--tRNA ligase subunit beta [Candidatus Diapherotrites archaeon]